jgi:hypothetical protein
LATAHRLTNDTDYNHHKATAYTAASYLCYNRSNISASTGSTTTNERHQDLSTDTTTNNSCNRIPYGPNVILP